MIIVAPPAWALVHCALHSAQQQWCLGNNKYPQSAISEHNKAVNTRPWRQKQPVSRGGHALFLILLSLFKHFN